ncbi:hypothetical protein [Clostridium felsineum]|uniref:Cell division protein FtsL n=1 Tax=Clostridium felsineum TaxID=36839 RepID=A0A1S8MDG1_9CLOT|nr:hypothetical protein [Clostridium felsineum]MCR3757853.1 hypothetical protein [Clostridium felsineum]URZ06362.1 Cell division protein FtsL [Clostridium felsineum]URZ11397.1 Cell division protein FtsL [Clostridium felsineum]URZ16058.1 Cell division protein FtsL [Clostridium felsineum DSM 794]
MIITDKEFQVKGSNALAPQKNNTDANERALKNYRERRKKEKRMKLIKKHIQMKKQARVILAIVAVFILGFTVLYRYSEIYSLQNKLEMVQNDSNNISGENDDLKLELFKNESIDNVAEKATGDLHMVNPDKNHATYTNLQKKSITIDKDTEASKSKGILEIIESKFF